MDSLCTPQKLSLVQVSERPPCELGIAQTASQGRVSRATLARRPLSHEGELLETVPGMILTQHSGDGKSNQVFVRAFNLDHGTDFQTRIESMPLNILTHGHGHGHGYTDLNVVIPELIDNIDYKLGPLYAEFGDFGSADGAHVAETNFPCRSRDVWLGAECCRAQSNTGRTYILVGRRSKALRRSVRAAGRLAKAEWRWTMDMHRQRHGMVAVGIGVPQFVERVRPDSTPHLPRSSRATACAGSVGAF